MEPVAPGADYAKGVAELTKHHKVAAAASQLCRGGRFEAVTTGMGQTGLNDWSLAPLSASAARSTAQETCHEPTASADRRELENERAQGLDGRIRGHERGRRSGDGES